MEKFVNFSGCCSILWGMEDVSASDVALASRARAGELEALAGLLERYRPSLYAAAIRMLRDRDEALDAVQDTCVASLVHLPSLRDPAAAVGWLHAVLHNVCLMRLRRSGRELPEDHVDVATVVPGPEEVLDQLELSDWVWDAVHELSPDDRVTVMLRYFSRCRRYEAIAAVLGVPVGTVRSRLNRARSHLVTKLRRTVLGSPLSHADLERARRIQWEDFYAQLHERPEARTYRDTHQPDIEVTDHVGRWRGLEDWSAHEREAIQLGVRARIVGVVASRDLTILEIDFFNPTWASDHCPPQSTFVHQLSSERSRRLDIHYV
jgi:RNA polymerase sigma-70 factor (ECF subfamily)